MTNMTKATRSFPFILALAIAPAAMAGDATLQIDQPAPAMGETVQASGVCAEPGESVKFSLKQKGKVHNFSAVGTTTEESFTKREGGFATNLDLAEIQPEPGVATLRATCADGKQLVTDLHIGVRTSTAGASTSLADEANRASSDKPGIGIRANQLTLASDQPIRVGQTVVVGGKCPVEDGVVNFSLEQNDKTFNFGDYSLVSGVGFRDKLDLGRANATAGEAKLVAACPGGKIISREIAIAE